MKFRYARHTNKLQAIIDFYTYVLGFKKLGSFENHEGYNGVFLGLGTSDWHLEFTESNDLAKHTPDEDDLVVFYYSKQAQIDHIIEQAKKLNIYPIKSKNPYWQAKGIELRDPDNYGVILTLE